MSDFVFGMVVGVMIVGFPALCAVMILVREVSFQKAKVRRLQPMTKETYQEMRGI